MTAIRATAILIDEELDQEDAKMLMSGTRQ
jgi:hypothetical protein